MLHNGVQVDSTEQKEHVLVISMLKNIFLLHMTFVISTLKIVFPSRTRMQDYHLTYPSVLL